MLSLPQCYVFGIQEMRLLYKISYIAHLCVFHCYLHLSMARLIAQLCGIKEISWLQLTAQGLLMIKILYP
jgi:hypothetical protein